MGNQTMPLTRQELGSMGCSTPGCRAAHSVMYLQPSCHTDADVEVAYIKAAGVLRITCAECANPVADVVVASALPLH